MFGLGPNLPSSDLICLDHPALLLRKIDKWGDNEIYGGIDREIDGGIDGDIDGRIDGGIGRWIHEGIEIRIVGRIVQSCPGYTVQAVLSCSDRHLIPSIMFRLFCPLCVF
jgi:hypothetical protein